MDDRIQQHLNAMDQQALIAEKGYQLFSRMFAQTNPKPDATPFVGRNFYTRIGLSIVMVASSIVSASHTIPTFANAKGREIFELNFIVVLVGVAAFFMSELALAIFAYVGVMRHYRETGEEPKSLKKLIKLGVIVPFAVMAAGNIHHEFLINDAALPEWISNIIILTISLAAPLMGYISGEIFATFEVTDRVDALSHDSEQRRRMDEWEAKCRQAWGRSKDRYGGNIRVEPIPNSIPVLSNGNFGMETSENLPALPSKSSIGHTKKPMAAQIVKEYFQSNPDALSGDAIEISKELGVGKSTVYNVMKEMRGG